MRIYEIEDYNDPNSKMYYEPKGLVAPELESIKHLADIIKQDCQQILKVYYDSHLSWIYRGEHTNESIFSKRIRPDRRPVGGENDMEKHEILAKWMESKGVHATRKNSIFGSCQQEVAEGWGSNVYVVFPRDGWWASWVENVSENSYSFYPYSELWWNAETAAGRSQFAPDGKKISKAEAYTKLLDDYFPQHPIIDTNNISQVSKYLNKKPYEILITGDSYIGINLKIMKSSVGTKLTELLF
jgi:hypothetical protein